MIPRPAAFAAALAALALAAPTASAQQATAAAESCRIPYAAFEESVPHLDLESCPTAPTGAGAEEAFCRLVVTGDRFTVYEFRPRAGGPCFSGVQSLSAADFLARHGVTAAGPAADRR